MKSVETSKIIYKKDHQPIELDIWEPSLQDWKEVTSDYNWILKNRFNNKFAMFKVQLGLIPDIDMCQKNINMYKDVRKNPENIKKYTDLKVNTEEPYIKRNLQKERTIIKALKEIMDGHLWRIFDYNRPLIYILGKQPGSTYLDTSDGGFNEIYAWADNILQSDNTHFLINNLTHSAKIGDVLSKTIDGKILLSEIKSSSLSSGTKQKIRNKRQKLRRLNFEKLANDGEGEFDNKYMKIVDIPDGYTNNLNLFKSLLDKTNDDGISELIYNDYLAITCVDKSFELPIDTVKVSLKNHLKISKNNDELILLTDSTIRNKFSPNFLPFSIYPISNKYIADLLFGKKLLFYSINITKILEIIKSDGWSIIELHLVQKYQSKLELPFCTIKKDKINIDVPWTIINQIIFELRDLKSILIEFNHILNISKSQANYFLSKYDNDKYIWD